MGKASTDKEIKSAQNAYDTAVKENTGVEGYKKIQNSNALRNAYTDTKRANVTGNELGNNQTNASVTSGLRNGANMTNAANSLGASGANSQMANINSNAQKYAGQQAAAAAAGAQSQATTAARAAGMNKAQAAMMGSQQNANAYQNAYGNAYGQQLGTANSAYENQANRANSNMNNMSNLYNSNANQYAAMQNANNQYQQSLLASMLGANVSGIGNQVSMAQAQDAQNFRQGGLFSDEKLKHYRECSKKVVMKTPSKIQSLKITTKGE